MHRHQATQTDRTLKLTRERLRVLQPEQLEDACGGTDTLVPIQKPGH